MVTAEINRIESVRRTKEEYLKERMKVCEKLAIKKKMNIKQPPPRDGGEEMSTV
ncbi:hypothetical protein [Paenibacillus sedimenti]|uniref:Uncharacterized protein n=1 Tax=Paenibacillus sedimenti TaxID=2770274 RepID=A0A926KXA1_9BACL|nr:hypothetical protein [Paenibacillus sedimenti]MBD0384856.1 hypothetical protein [Paenibacillus sedimenti]